MTYFRLAGMSFCLSAGLIAANASGQAAPTTAPAPVTPATPAKAPLDQTTPKALLKTFFLSRGEVDEATVRSLLHATGPVEQKILDSVVQIELAHGRLRSAEKEKFGAAAVSPPPSVTANGLEPDSPEELDSLEEIVTGDRATVSTPKVPGMSMQFVRVDGRWKLPIASLVGTIDPSMAETMDSTTRAQVQIIDAIAAEVRGGKFATAEQVNAELSRRFAERLAAATKSPQTSPATAPVSQPARGT